MEKENIDELNNKIIELHRQVNGLLANEDEVRRKGIMLDEKIKFNNELHKSQLLTIFFLLEQIEKVGTHHEKEVVIRYIRMIIHSFMIKYDNINVTGYDDLPF